MNTAPPAPSDAARNHASIFLTATISLALLLAGAVHGVQRWTELRRDTWAKLTALADHDLQQVRQWRNERLAVGRSLQHDGELVRRAGAWRDRPDDPGLLEDFTAHLRAQAADVIPLQGLFLAAGERRVNLALPADSAAAPAPPAAGRAKATEVALVPVPPHAGEPRQMALRIPLHHDPQAPVVLEIREDVETGMVAQWSGIRRLYKSGSILLLEREGATLRFVSTDEGYTPAQADAFAASPFGALLLRGQRGTMRGTDLQARDCFAHASDLPQTPWMLVHLVERTEVEGPFLRQTLALACIYLLLLWAGGGTLFGLWKGIRQRQALAESQLARQRDAVARQVEYLNRNDRHAVLTLSAEGRVLEANARACEIYGYRADEFQGLELATLHAGGTEGAAAEARHLAQPDGATFDSRHRTRDGQTLDVEISMQPGEWHGQACLHCIVRDISERRMAERKLRESEELYRSLFHGANDALLVLEGERIIDCNPRAVELYGWPREHLVGHSMLRLTPDDRRALPHADEICRAYLDNAQAGQLRRVECEQQRRDGSLLLAEVAFSPVRLGDRPVLQAIVRDITEQRRTEQELQRSRAELEEAEALAHLGHWSVSLESRRLRLSRQLTAILDLPAGAEVSDPDHLLAQIEGPDRVHLMQRIDRTIRYGEQSELTLRYRRQDGANRWLYVRIDPRRNSAGVVTDLFGTIVDITAQKSAEAALHESMARYRNLVEQIPAVVYARPLRSDSPAAFVSPQIELITGFTAEEWLADGDAFAGRVLPEDLERVQQAAQRCQAGEGAMNVEYRMRSRDGRTVWVHDQATVLHDHAGQPLCIQGVLMDITARRHSEETLHLLQTALAAAANGVIITDAEGGIQWVNEAIVRLYGYGSEELLGKTPRVLRSPRQDARIYAGLWETIRAGRVWHGDIVNRCKNGQELEEEMTITPVRNPEGVITHFVAIKQDVTDRRKLQRQMLRGQKMECLGRLAGGVAHDFNNLLQTITGCSELLLESMPATGTACQELQEIQQAATRASALTRQLLVFSRRQTMETKSIDLADLLDGMVKMLRRLLGEDIVLEMVVAAALPPVLADHGQLEQVVMNLALNARDAMPRGGGLLVSAAHVDLGTEDAASIPGSRPGSFIRLRVEDTGTGMPPDVLEHIFEPFFSTKAPEKGTGLGLAVVYGIVQQHGGFMQVASEAGTGSRFDLWLPVAPAGQDAAIGPAEIRLPPVAGHGERILIVEDEARVCRTVVQILRSARYEVVAATTAAEAREQFRLAEGRFALLLVDVVLPDGMGTELADELLLAKPNLKIIFHSGYSDDKSRWAVIQERGFLLLQKPYRREVLLQALEDTLRGPASAVALMTT